jgi:TFIIF-interacting CTD phosphatase-like protein
MTKPNLILDLDQTLISAEEIKNLKTSTYKKKSKLFTVHDMDGYYNVFSRPYLQEFLDYAFKNFNVSVWTAASKDYALFIIKNIVIDGKPERELDYIFFSYHCDISKNENNYSKKLCMLWDFFNLPGYNEKNTVILDDFSEEVHECQPNNCIIAPAFEFLKNKSDKDTFLKDIIPKLNQMKNRIKNKEFDMANSINNL